MRFPADALFGRENETAFLQDRIDGLSRQGGAVLVHGEPGIGKTALLEEAARHGTQGRHRVLTTVGVESETLLPFSGLHQLIFPFRSLIGDLPNNERDALQAALGITDAPVHDVFLVALAALNLLARAAADTPLLLVVDDVHWLDGASAEVLSFLSRRLESEPILLMAAMRDGYPSHLTRADIPGLAVGPLSAEASALLLDERAPGLARVARQQLLKEAAGNPLALTELATDAPGHETISPDAPWTPMSRRLQDAFTARLRTLPDTTRRILLTAACDDSPSLTEILSVASPRPAAAVTAADLAPAVSARLVETAGDTVRFRHPLMRSAIRQAAPAALRREVHAALARCLPPGSDRRTWHEAAATVRPDARLADRLEAAADRAYRRGGAADSVFALEQAARLSDEASQRIERLLKAADQAVDTGQQHLLTRLLDAATPWATTPQQRARIQWIKGGLEDGMRDASEGTALLTRLVRTVMAQDDHDLAVRILWSAALRCLVRTRRRGPAVTSSPSPTRCPSPTRSIPRILAILAYAQPVPAGAGLLTHLRRAAGRTAGDAQADRLVGSAAVLVGDFELAEELSEVSVPGLRARAGSARSPGPGRSAWSGAPWHACPPPSPSPRRPAGWPGKQDKRFCMASTSPPRPV
ncbi:ATP-binding protein, partial [Streptomyces canarius]